MFDKDSEVSIKGNDNSVIGRDLVINIGDIKGSDNKLYKIIERKLQTIDRIVSERVKGIKLHYKDDLEPFSSEKIIASMGRIGIPLTPSIKAVTIAARIIVGQSSEKDVFKTSDVRRCITEALYTLDENEFCSNDIEDWAGSYVRRYGTETVIKVIMGSKTESFEENLAHKFILNTLLPDVYNAISGEVKHDSKSDITDVASTNMMRRMAISILEAVKSLSLYRIHYDVLFALTKEMALQPPHPWFAPKVRSFDYIYYDYKQYKRHFEKSKRYYSSGDYGGLVHSIKEMVDHCCSAVLCHYSIYMGCGTLASFYVLKDLVKEICKNKGSDAALFFRTNEIKSDFSMLSINIEEFSALLNKLYRGLERDRNRDELSIESVYLDAQTLVEITTKIIAPFIRRNKYEQTRKMRTISLDDIFLGFPFLKWTPHESSQAYWISHNYDTPLFREIKSQILVVPLDVLEIKCSDIKFWVSEVENKINFSNTIIFIYRGADSFPRENFYNEKKVGINLINVPFDDLLEATVSDEPMRKVADLLFENSYCV
ncbi:hypothetical protein INR79_22375 [Vibrio sp. SCSIO 43132]|uniref:hypothetical protein n=1 Tax=Vibrio sp. SCSIO 43132 TaxID=2779363 RepID=UPI001CAA3F0F|nr:hypothetical protein [Vibrio sp. SCSIO 43132]UAB73890.1 hypothetical protein INR79_22375 [Vibrio sp. SCSIO 43132]